MTSGVPQDRTATIFGENPLLAGLAPYCTLKEMPKRMLREPLAKTNWRELTPALREPLLERIRDHFFPTSDAICIAMAIQNATFESLRMRNPASPAERARTNRLITLTGQESETEFRPLESPVAGGMVLAETGLGKTAILKVSLSAIAPEKVIHHGLSEKHDWARLLQIAYLYIDLPANSTPWALCLSLAGAIDALLGTEYAKDVARSRNADIAMYQVCKYILMHRVGCVVIDESQDESFDENRSWGGVFIKYFKRLLNFGVPVVLSGHPDAFAQLMPSGQLGRRFSGIGRFELVRAVDRSAPWWDTVFTVGVMRFCLVESIRDTDAVKARLSYLSAGVPDFFCVLWKEAQRIALRRDGSMAELSVEDVDAATRSPGFQALSEMAVWLDADEPTPGLYTDLTPKPSTSKEGGVLPPAGQRRAQTQVPDAVKKLRDSEKRAEKARSAREKAINLSNGLSEGDLRKAAASVSESESGLEGLVQGSLDLTKPSSDV